MKKVVVAMLLLFAACSTPEPKLNPSEDAGNKAALEVLKKESKIKEFVLTEVNVLYVAVEDDGTRRDGYADYICEVLSQNRASCKLVKVVKAFSTKDPKRDNAYGVLIGESHCK